MDDRQINTYGYDSLAKVLANQDQMLKLVVMRLNRNDLNTNPGADDLALIDAVDNYIVKMLMTDPSKLDRNVIINYRDKLFDMFKKNPSIAYDSILFRKDIALKLFTTPQIKEIIAYKMRTSANVNNRLRSIIKMPNMTIDDEIIRYAEYQIGNDNPQVINMLDNLYKYLLENKKDNTSLRTKEFIIRYTSYMASKDLNVPFPKVYISNYKLGGKEMAPKNLGTSYGNSGIITINRDSLINNVTISKEISAMSQYIQVVSHETKHSAQSYQFKNNEVSKAGFEMLKQGIFSNYLSSKDYDEYHSNYIHSEIENDADDYGWYFACKLISKYAPKEGRTIEELASKRIKNAFQQLTATKVDNVAKKHVESWNYNVSKLNEIVKNNPKILTKYPILNKLYNTDGEMYSFMELLHIENDSQNEKKDELAKIFEDYYTYHLASGNVFDIDPTKLSLDDAFLFYSKLTDMLINEYNNINHSIKVFDKYEKHAEFRQTEFMHVNASRIDRIIALVNYMNESNDLINQLAAIDTQRDNNQRAFGFKLGYIAQKHSSLVHYISKLDTYGITDSEMIAKFEMLKDNVYDTKGRGM